MLKAHATVIPNLVEVMHSHLITTNLLKLCGGFNSVVCHANSVSIDMASRDNLPPKNYC